MTDTNKPADVGELMNLVAQGKYQFLQLARTMLDADTIVAGWTREATVKAADACKDRGCRLVLEISASEDGMTKVALVAVSPTGEREQIDSVSEKRPRSVN